jgi:hypothetical protein
MAIERTINNLREIILDANCERMNLSTVKGFLGELIVKEQLEKSGFSVLHHGNQTGYDLSIGQGDNIIKIDVKASLLKDEYKWGCHHWGWALVHSNKKKVVSATHFVCLGFKNNLIASRFFIVPSKLATNFPNGIKQFSKVNHSMCAFPGKERPIGNLSPEESIYIDRCQELLRDTSVVTLQKDEYFKIDCFK